MYKYIKASTQMRHFIDEELQEILDNLDKGVIYCGIQKYGNGNSVGRGVIYKTNDGYIGWQHAGESANSFTIDELRFVLETIFSDCVDICEAEYDSEFFCYAPTDPKYSGFDYNRKHKEVEEDFRKYGYWLDPKKDRHKNLEFTNDDTGNVLKFNTWDDAKKYLEDNYGLKYSWVHAND